MYPRVYVWINKLNFIPTPSQIIHVFISILLADIVTSVNDYLNSYCLPFPTEKTRSASWKKVDVKINIVLVILDT